MWFLKKTEKNFDTVDAVSLFLRWVSVVDSGPADLNVVEPLGDSVLEKALWVMLTARLYMVVSVADLWIKERIGTHIAPLISNHATEIDRQYRKLCQKDRYGILDDSGWFSEKEYFIERVIAPVLMPLLEELKKHFREMATNLAVWNQRFDDLDEKSNYRDETTLIEAPKVPIDIIKRLRGIGAVHKINALFCEWLVSGVYSQNDQEHIDNMAVIFNKTVHRTALEEINGLLEGVITDKGVIKNSTKSNHDIISMSPYDYEEYCADILNKNGWTAKATKKSGDQGADVYAERDGISVVIQCKLTNAPVGNKAVQEVISGQKYMAADYAAVVSPAAYTPGARDLAKTAHVLLLGHDDLKDLAHIITLTL